jgi:hypothetical protein
MRSKIVSSTLFASAILLLVIGSAAYTPAYPRTAAQVSHNYAPSLKTVSVSVSFSPKKLSEYSGMTVHNTLKATNPGSSSIILTGCLFYYKTSTASKYVKGNCGLGSKYTIAAGKYISLSWATTLYGSAGTTYDVKVYLTNSADVSGPGYYQVQIL